jgi:hypothetical protein
MALTLLDRQRRVARLCCHCIRNIAFYRAWYLEQKPHEEKNFWVNANGNFLDIAVMEWCKLFAERGKHDWATAVMHNATFLNDMLTALGKTTQEWDEYKQAMRKYRDKYVAHWDDLDVITTPELDIAKDSAGYLLDHLVEFEGEGPEQWDGVPYPAAAFYDQRLADGRAACRATYP